MADNFKTISDLDISFKEFMPGQIIQSAQFNDDMKDIEEKVNEVIGQHNEVASTVVDHLNNKNNPHEVTAHQVGTYTTTEIDGFVEDIKHGHLYDRSITNSVLADWSVDNRTIKDRTITASKVEDDFGNQIDISGNIDIIDRYTKNEVDELVRSKVGEGAYTKEEIDQKFEEFQAGQIIDKTISADKVTSDFGDNIDISNNTSITNRYTKGEVDMLISMNGLPRDWGNITEQVDIDTGTGSLPVAGHMVAGQFVSPATSVLDIDVKENVEARGEYSSVGERLDGVDSQIKDIANNFTTEQTDDEFIIKYNNTIIAAIPLGSQVSRVYGEINCITGSLSITEGGTGSFVVNLSSPPTTTQVVNISCDNSNISIYPNKLSFTSDNYNVNQTVTVTAADDTLLTDYTATIILSSANVSDVSINVNVTNTDESVFNRCILDVDLSEYDTADTFTNTINSETFTKDENGKVYIGNSVLDIVDINSEGSLTFGYLMDKTNLTSNNQGIYGVNIKTYYDNGGLGWNAYIFNIGIFYNNSAANSIYVPNTSILGDKTELPDKTLVTWTCRTDGSVDYYINGSKVYSTDSPSDWTSWDYLYGMVKNKSAFTSSNFVEHVYVFKGEFTDSDAAQLYEVINSDFSVKDIRTFEEVNLQVGENIDLYYEVTPYKIVEDEEITLSVDNPLLVNINGNTITALENGSTTLSIQAKNFTKEIPLNVGKQISDTSLATVTSARTAEEVYIINPVKTMKVGDNHMIWACCFDNSTNFLYDQTTQDNIVNITSDNPSVVSTQFGVLFANGTGTATITATDITGTKSTSFTVTVEPDLDYAVSNVLNVNLSTFNLDNTGTTGTGITNCAGLVSLFSYATENGYDKIVFPQGTYNFNGDYGTITYPSNMIIDWNNSIIQLEFRNNVNIADWEHIRANNKYAYTMFALTNTENCIVMNGKFYGENYLDDGGHHIEHELMFNILGSCGDSRFINCEFSYAPGFNVNLGHKVYNDTRTAFKLNNAEMGGLTATGENDDTITTRFRTADYISLNFLNNYKDTTLTFGLGNMQGYGGYAYVKGRFYNIYFFDENHNFISKLDKCVQFEYYTRPANSAYCKIEFYQDYLPTSCDDDFGGVVHIFALNELKSFRFENCKFEYNQSTGLCPQGGTGIIIDNCQFINNGFYDPSSHIDWEDGGQHIHGHIVKNCVFKSTDSIKHTIINVKSRSVVLYNNTFDYVKYEQRPEVESARIFKNKIINSSIFELSSKTDMVYAYNVQNATPTINTVPDGMNIWQFDNYTITQ